MHELMFPLQPYNRFRESGVTPEEYENRNFKITAYAGTTSDPWKIIAQNTYTDSVMMRSMERSMADVVTPLWEDRQARGEIINNPMESVTTRWYRGMGIIDLSMINRSLTTPYTYTGATYLGTDFVGNNYTEGSGWAYPDAPVVSDSHIAQAIGDAYSKISLNKADLLVQIGEFEKTVIGLVSIFKRVIGIFKALKKLDLKYLRNEISLKELKNRYLELRYSLRPLFFDARGLVEVFTSDRLESDRLTYRGYKIRVGSNEYTNVPLFTYNNVNYGYTIYGNQIGTRIISVRAGVLTSVISDFNRNWLLSLGVTELIPSVWEMIPFSFIADWFFSIGKWISMWTPKVGFNILASWISVDETENLASTAVSGVPTYPHNYSNYVVRTGTYQKEIVKRYRLPNPDRPSLPWVNVNLDLWKLLDLGAILSQLLASALEARKLRL